MNSPKLSPACPGWQEDLPLPDATPVLPPCLGLDTPNHQDEIFLELSRYPIRARGVVLFISLLSVAATYLLAESLVIFYTILNWKDLLLSYSGMALSVWITTIGVRLEISPPRDLPLRFNRRRQRMYAYNYIFCWWNPFKRWEVAPVAYDWSDVRAERWQKCGATVGGGIVMKWGVVISIIKPGTYKVIDRFPLSTMGADEFAWSYICTYMQQGPSVLPTPDPPRDHNYVPWYNLALRLAPAVKWPDDMDRESRTTPERCPS